jgi:hypothetical protein
MDAETTMTRREYMKNLHASMKARGFHRVSATLSSEEFARLKESADAHGERVTTHLKRCAFAHLDTRYLVPPDIGERLDALLAVMRGIGNNLNQLARYSNEMRYFLDTDEVRLQLKRMHEEIRRFVVQPERQSDDAEPPP